MYLEKLKSILIYVFLFFIIGMSIQTCVNGSRSNSQASEIVKLFDKQQVLKKHIDEQDREITSTRSLVFDRNSVIEKQVKEIAELKSLSSKVKIINKTIYDTLEIVMNDTIIIEKNDSLLTKKFRFKDEWLVVDGFLNRDVVKFDSLAVNNKFIIETGREKIGFMKYQTSVFVRNENPHTITNELQSIVIKEKKKWYEKDAWKMGLALFGGFLLGKR